jgi:hypothetical protein
MPSFPQHLVGADAPRRSSAEDEEDDGEVSCAKRYARTAAGRRSRATHRHHLLAATLPHRLQDEARLEEQILQYLDREPLSGS